MAKTTIHVKCSNEECSFEGDVIMNDNEDLAHTNCKACGLLGTMKPHKQKGTFMKTGG